MVRLNAALMRINAAFIRGRRLITFLFVTEALIRVRRLFEGGVYSRAAFNQVYGSYNMELIN